MKPKLDLLKPAFNLNYLDYFILACIFLIPLIWSKYLNANYVSAKTFLVYFISSFSLVVSSRRLVIPKLPRVLMYSLIFLIVLHLISPVISQSWTHFYYTFKFISFSLLAYYFYTLPFNLEAFLKKYDYIILVVSGLIIAFACNDFYYSRIDRLDTQSGLLLGSFGNVNMVAEFLVLSLPFIHLWMRIKTSIHSVLKTTILIGWLFFILYCRSRSAWIGLGLWGVWSVWNKQVGKKEILAVIIGFTLYHVSFLAPAVEVAAALGGAKQDSFGQRLHLYQTTLRLIADHPFGVGVGQYITEIVPYLVNSDFKPMEYVFFDQPHSEILKWAVQFGWLGFLLPALILAYLFVQIYKQKNFFLTSSFMVLLPQIAFQFPFENPASLTYISFLFACCLKLYPVAREHSINIKKRILFNVIAVVGMFHSVAFVSSIFFETSHGNRLDLVMYSCDVYPININACFNRAHFLLTANNLVLARYAMAENLTQFPFHAGMLRLFPIYLKNAVGDKPSCEAVLMYDSIFSDQKFFQKELLQQCSSYKVPLTHQNPQQFKQDYLKWQRQFFN